MYAASLPARFHLSNQPPTLLEPAAPYGKPRVPPGQVLAGTDLSKLWEVAQFVLNGRSYAREFMDVCTTRFTRCSPVFT